MHVALRVGNRDVVFAQYAFDDETQVARYEAVGDLGADFKPVVDSEFERIGAEVLEQDLWRGLLQNQAVPRDAVGLELGDLACR